MIRRVLLICAVLGLLSASASARVWTDNRGEKVEGTFVRVHEGQVVIKTVNAFNQQRLLRVPFEVLSSEDQEWVIADLKKNGRIKQLESVQAAKGKSPTGNASPRGGEGAPSGRGEPGYPQYNYDNDGPGYFQPGAEGNGGAGMPEGYPQYNYENDTEEYLRSSDPGDAVAPSGDYPKYEYGNEGEEYLRSSDPGGAVEPSGDYPRYEHESNSDAYFDPRNSDEGMPNYGDGSYDTGDSPYDGAGYDATGNPLPPPTSNGLPSTASTTAAAPYGSASAAAPVTLQCDTCGKDMPSGTGIGDACPHCAEAADEEDDESSSAGLLIALIIGGAALVVIVVVVVAIVVVAKKRPQPAAPNYFQQSAFPR